MTPPTRVSPTLLPLQEVLSPRHSPTWMALAGAAGAVNAGAWIACERFVSHVTGISTLIGVDFGVWLLMAEYGLVLLAFLVGAMVAVFAIQGRTLRGRPPWPSLPLCGSAALLVATALLGRSGAFGRIGGEVEQPADFVFLGILAFSMGLLNAAVASSTNSAVRITHMTGPTTDLGVHLATAWLAVGDDRIMALRHAALRATKLIAFIAGAALMGATIQPLGYLAFLLPAVAIVLATLVSFVPRELRRAADTPRPDAAHALERQVPSPEAR